MGTPQVWDNLVSGAPRMATASTIPPGSSGGGDSGPTDPFCPGGYTSVAGDAVAGCAIAGS